MQIRLVVAAALLLPQLALACSFTGTMTEGGGDAKVVNVKASSGQPHYAYCAQSSACADLFEFDEETEQELTKKAVLGKRVTVHFANEANRGRVAGPGDDEIIPIVKKIVFAKPRMPSGSNGLSHGNQNG